MLKSARFAPVRLGALFSGALLVVPMVGGPIVSVLGCATGEDPDTKSPALGSQAAAPGDGTAASVTGASTDGTTAPPGVSVVDGTGAPSNTGVAANTGDVASPGGSAPSPVNTGDAQGPVNTGVAVTAAASSDTATPGSSVVDGAGGSAAVPSAVAMGGAGTVPLTGTATSTGGAAVVPGDPPVSEIPGAGMAAGKCTLGAGQQAGEGQTLDQYFGADVTRDGLSYRMITNGWGMNWVSHDISWLGSSLSINTYDGSRQDNGAPAGYPSVFCGRYSDTSMDCGLPKALSAVTALNTAVSWSHPLADGTYNVAYDVWLGDGQGTGFRSLQSYFMVWLKDPADESPAGSLLEEGVTVANAPGTWNIIAGEVNGLPIVNYVRAEGDELHALAFDIMDFIRDGQTRALEFPGNDVLAVAIGFEIWQGPVTGLKLEDFCLDIQ